jgi:putative lipoic acid-binding regulatory protein
MEPLNFDSLKEKLETGFDWPRVYLFKFIVPSDNKKIAEVENLFNSKEAEINLRTSKKGNYVSVSAKEMMISPDKVIERYKEAAKIEGIISL